MYKRQVPKYAEEDRYSSTMERTVKAGKVIGMGAVSTVETEEGITIEDECIGIVYGKDDCDFNRWTIYGDPDVTLEIKNPPTVGPVSYTHLDVYKRQHQDGCVSVICQRPHL